MLRRLQVSRELSDALVLEVLGACSPVPLDQVPGKYHLMNLCSYGAFEQAALWVLERTHPAWSLETTSCDGVHVVRLLSRHAPPLTVERRSSRLGTALLEAVVQATMANKRVGL